MFQVCIEGNIGVGKSSVVEKLRALLPHATVVPEPAAEWEDRGLLHQMYKDPQKHANSFQQSALVGIVAAQAHVPTSIMITERSIYSNKHVFSKLHLDPKERLNYDYTYDKLTEMLPCRQVFFVLLTAPPDVLLNRIRQRGRASEQNIDINYLQNVEEAHSDWLDGETRPVVKIDGTLSPDQIAECIRLQIVSYDNSCRRISALITSRHAVHCRPGTTAR